MTHVLFIIQYRKSHDNENVLKKKAQLYVDQIRYSNEYDGFPEGFNCDTWRQSILNERATDLPTPGSFCITHCPNAKKPASHNGPADNTHINPPGWDQ